MSRHHHHHDDFRDALKRFKCREVDMALTAGDECCKVSGCLEKVAKDYCTLTNSGCKTIVAIDKIAAFRPERRPHRYDR